MENDTEVMQDHAVTGKDGQADAVDDRIDTVREARRVLQDMEEEDDKKWSTYDINIEQAIADGCPLISQRP